MAIDSRPWTSPLDPTGRRVSSDSLTKSRSQILHPFQSMMSLNAGARSFVFWICIFGRPDMGYAVMLTRPQLRVKRRPQLGPEAKAAVQPHFPHSIANAGLMKWPGTEDLTKQWL